MGKDDTSIIKSIKETCVQSERRECICTCVNIYSDWLFCLYDITSQRAKSLFIRTFHVLMEKVISIQLDGCICVCINGCYRPKSRAGIILSNRLSAGLGISGMLEASLFLPPLFSVCLPNGSICFTLSTPLVCVNTRLIPLTLSFFILSYWLILLCLCPFWLLAIGTMYRVKYK